MSYEAFIQAKRKNHLPSGFDWNDHPDYLFPFQAWVVRKSLASGKYGIFSGTGTGKTRMQLTWCREVCNKTMGKCLILVPLAVRGQTMQQARELGFNMSAIDVMNYEQIDNINLDLYKGIALDEGSILKNHEGAYRNMLIEQCKNIAYKSVWTATPSPNDPMEIGNYSEFLDIMPRNEMLAMYFVHDGGETSKWRLKGHCEQLFWDWVSTWAVMFQRPSDIGFEQDGYDLPPLNLIETVIQTPKRENGSLCNNMAVSATNFNAELRLTKDARLKEVVRIVNSKPDESFIIWIKQNEEGELLRKLLPEAIEVKGADDVDYKEEKLLGFARGEFRLLITKGKIAGMGMNYQNCHNQIFAAPDFSFETVFQSIRRSWRFGQTEQVNAYIIATDTMSNVTTTLYRKQEQFEAMQQAMTNAVNKNLSQYKKMERENKVIKNDQYELRLGDCVSLIKDVPDESIGFSIYSPPFAELYTYSDELEDMGNSKDYKEFLTAYGYLANELYRVLISGRNVAVHCMDLPIQKGKEGFIGLRSFSNMIIGAMENAGFIYHSEIVCWKNPVTEMQRTKALGLLHKQIKKDATMSRVGIPDKVLVFRKDGERNDPVTHQDSDPSKPDYLPVDLWQRYASPVWMDVDFGNTLNARSGRDEKDEKHICPLSLDIIKRCLHLWTNEGDTVLTPFAGIGSEVYQSVLMNRKAIGFELKTSYFNEAVKNLDYALQTKKQTTLL
jgi:DNA modification methylase